jgi:naphthoate synthase
VPLADLMTEARDWARQAADMSPTALRALKHAFNADGAHIYGQAKMAADILRIFGTSDEAMEGKKAFAEKRKPDFSPYR